MTARIEDEAKLRVQSQMFRILMDNLDIAMFAIDTQGTYTFEDGSVGSKIGIDPKQFLGKNIFELYGGDSDMPHIRGAFEGKPAYTLIEEHGRHWETRYVPVPGERGEITSVVGISLDVTPTKRAEHELRAKLDLIDKQQQVIRELSTPIIEVWSKVHWPGRPQGAELVGHCCSAQSGGSSGLPTQISQWAHV